MNGPSSSARRQLEALARNDIQQLQLEKLNRLLASILPHNDFYRARLGSAVSCSSLADIRSWPLTTKADLIPDDGDASQHAKHLTYAASHYSRFHRTSGTQGNPLVILDTPADWQWWIATWQFVLDAANVTSNDRAVMAFSFGPFVGFWSANDALAARGALVIPGGGLSTSARVKLILDEQATVVCCTPSYALHMAAVADDENIRLKQNSKVRHIIVAGEPGGSMPSIQKRIADAWQAEVIDHAGATEIGPWGYANEKRSGLHIVESEFIAEFLPLAGGSSATAPTGNDALDWAEVANTNDTYELVLTSLGRPGAPLLRYRTGDLVRPRCLDYSSNNQFAFLEGGVLGRVDDMMIVRGVNVYPSAIEQILREFAEVVEYRLTVYKRGEMDAIRIEVEAPQETITQAITDTLQLRLGLQVEAQHAAPNSLPRFELKGRRFVDER